MQPGFGTSGPNQFGEPLRRYSFLVSGAPANGPRIQDVPGLISKMDSQIANWEAKYPGRWSKSNALSRKRCVDARLSQASKDRNPLPNDPHHSIACPRCVERDVLCVVVGVGYGPVVVPLPPSDRSPNATPRDPGYYVKQG